LARKALCLGDGDVGGAIAVHVCPAKGVARLLGGKPQNGARPLETAVEAVQPVLDAAGKEGRADDGQVHQAVPVYVGEVAALDVALGQGPAQVPHDRFCEAPAAAVREVDQTVRLDPGQVPQAIAVQVGDVG